VAATETGATVEYSLNGTTGWTTTAPTAIEGSNTVYARQTDVAGNTSAASSALTFTLDTTAPTVVISEPANSPSGALTFGFTFSEAVTGFDASDVDVGNGTEGSVVKNDDSHYSLVVTPTSSSTPLNLTVAVPAAGATDFAGNASAVAASQFLASILYGTAGHDTLTVGPSLDHIFLGAGADVVKVTSAANSTVQLPDHVMDFAAGDKINLSALLGTGGSAYAGSALGDSGAGFIELKNVTLTQDSANGWTVVNFDIKLDANNIGGSKIDGINLDLNYDTAKVIFSEITSPQYLVGPSAKPVWTPLDGNFLSTDQGANPTGKIAMPANTAGTNPIIVDTASGNVLNVKLYVSGLVNTFDIAIQSKASGGTTDVHTVNGVTTNVDVGITKTAGLTIGANGVLEIITDTTTLGTVGDNQLHMVSTYDAQQNTTHLQVQYDTNSTFGTNTPSTVIAFDFDGNVTANLTPASLTFI
jgi:hypothetical protein